MGKFIGKWAGGRIRQGRHGRQSYLIERMHRGERRPITLCVDSEAEALAELALFERDPSGYLAQVEAGASQVRPEGLCVDEDLVGKFLGHLRGEDGEDARTEHYIQNAQHALAWWAENLDGADLRRVTLEELQNLLDQAKGRKLRIIALKSFCSWLRTRGKLTRANDPTLDLRVPQGTPEKSRREKSHSMELVERTYRALEEQAIRDAVCLRSKTGMHHTEVNRLAKGAGELRELKGQGQIAATITFPHKRGTDHTVSIDAQTLAAVKRLRARGCAPAESWMAGHLKAAAKHARLERLELGALRHSFSTWAADEGVEVRPTERGLSLDKVAAVMGHASPLTTKRFYNASRVPPMIALPGLKLHHPADPSLLAERANAVANRRR